MSFSRWATPKLLTPIVLSFPCSTSISIYRLAGLPAGTDGSEAVDLMDSSAAYLLLWPGSGQDKLTHVEDSITFSQSRSWPSGTNLEP